MSYPALIYSHTITPRLQYIVGFLSQYYGLEFGLTSSEDRYRSANGQCRINYSYHRIISDEIWIHSHVLLFESSIRQVKIECFEKNSYKAFFKTEGDFGFDLFAAIFYLLVRYEEYLPYHNDSYGRYAHENSLAFTEGFLHLPLINIWLEDFRILLIAKSRLFTAINKKFSFIPTYDIDMAWSFKNKGFKRNAGGIIQLFIKGKWKRIASRIKVLKNKQQDPFDAYPWLDNIHQQYHLDPVYFFLVAKERSKLDKNIDVDNIEFRQLMHSIAGRYRIGLHPSWASGDLPSLLIKEKQLLEQITRKPVHSSRQHYIRFNAVTFKRLLTIGIHNDYSMGYGSINGFRASIANPYFWYDLKNEENTVLVIHPFCFMDANAYYEQQLTSSEALKELMQYYSIIKSVHGTMITIWHNSFLGSDDSFKGWKEVYEEFLKTVISE